DYCMTCRTSGSQHSLCQIPLPHVDDFFPDADCERHPALRFYSHSRKLNEFAIEQLVDQFWGDARFHDRRPALIVGHTVSVPTTRTVLKRTGQDPSTYVDSFPQYGNTVSASLPLGLSLGLGSGRVQRGEEILLIMGSAGVTTAFCRFKY